MEVLVTIMANFRTTGNNETCHQMSFPAGIDIYEMMTDLYDLMDIFAMAIPKISLILQLVDEDLSIKVLHKVDSVSDAWSAPFLDLGETMSPPKCSFTK
jgi:hypothetical protein